MRQSYQKKKENDWGFFEKYAESPFLVQSVKVVVSNKKLLKNKLENKALKCVQIISTKTKLSITAFELKLILSKVMRSLSIKLSFFWQLDVDYTSELFTLA